MFLTPAIHANNTLVASAFQPLHCPDKNYSSCCPIINKITAGRLRYAARFRYNDNRKTPVNRIMSGDDCRFVKTF
jgi:hypothetical protein